MNTPSKAAKAAAIMALASLVKDFDQAVRIYDDLKDSDDPVDDVLERHRCMRWSAVSDDLDDASWWEEVEMLAVGIDAAREHFKEN